MSLYTQSLLDAGFSRHQATVYAHLVETGPQTASILARHTGISRTLMYRVLDELVELGLVEKKDEKGAVSLFIPAHPIKLHDMVERRKKEAEQAAASIGSIVDNLTSEYNKAIGKPGVLFYEGVSGIERVYEDTIFNNQSKSIEVIRSHLDDSVLGADFFAAYATLRAQHSIQTRIISPEATTEKVGNDPTYLKTRKHLPDLKIPAEIDIYDNKVAIIAFDEPLIGTIIEKKAVAETLRTIFNMLWNQTKPTQNGNGL